MYLQMDDVLQQLTKLQGTNESREKMLETQKHVSREKLESSRLNHLAAKENAKSAMLETYRALSMKDTSAMPDDVRAEHLAFMKCVRESLFGKSESGINSKN
jgi:acyl-homoserine lactone acylase PvdQ